ncbi:MAG: hypothetical protein A2X36_16915 [Elusimicrobia bacterium GWA2_69_24]|nr:MAG: hypothetical protein A2X36_16915 [Elusimicrobia bacterium GWA2_69_24]
MGFLVSLFMSVSASVCAAEAPAPRFSVKLVGPLFDKAKNVPILGQDGAYSIPLTDGTALWTFGDTLVGEILPDGKDRIVAMPSSTYGLMDATDPYSLKGNLMYFRDAADYPLHLLRYDADEMSSVRRFWPQHGVQVGKRIYVYYTLIQAFGTGMWDFASVGQGLAVAEHPAGPYQRLRYKDNPAFWNDIQPAFGGAVLKGNDGWIYLYGRGPTGPGKYSLFLARVKGDRIGQRDAYEYYTNSASAPGWTKRVHQAFPLFENGQTELSVSYNPFLGKYLMVYSDLLAQDTVLRLADQPWGPWGAAIPAAHCAPIEKDDLCYAAKEHSELALDRGRRVFITSVHTKNYVPELHELRFEPPAP